MGENSINPPLLSHKIFSIYFSKFGIRIQVGVEIRSEWVYKIILNLNVSTGFFSLFSSLIHSPLTFLCSFSFPLFLSILYSTHFIFLSTPSLLLSTTLYSSLFFSLFFLLLSTPLYSFLLFSLLLSTFLYFSLHIFYSSLLSTTLYFFLLFSTHFLLLSTFLYFSLRFSTFLFTFSIPLYSSLLPSTPLYSSLLLFTPFYSPLLLFTPLFSTSISHSIFSSPP